MAQATTNMAQTTTDTAKRGERGTLGNSAVRPDGLAKVQALSQIIEAHYVWMEQQLGKTKLTALYNLLDQVIALEVPAAHLDAHSEAHALNDVNEDAEALDLEAIEK